MTDRKRHKEFLHLPFDWPRINQFPEYFTVEKEKNYRIKTENGRKEVIISGEELQKGYQLKLSKGEKVRMTIELM